MILAATRPEDLLEVCDSLSVLRDGKLVWSGDTTAAGALAAPQFANTVRVTRRDPRWPRSRSGVTWPAP